MPLPEIVSPVVFVTPDTARVTGAAPPIGVMLWLYAIPTPPAGRVAGPIPTSELTTNEYTWLVPVPTASLGVTVKVTVPVEVGVPDTLIVPVPLPEIVKPVVLVTPDTLSVTGAVPPVEVIVWL